MKSSIALPLLFLLGASSGSWFFSAAKELPPRHLRQREIDANGRRHRKLEHHGQHHPQHHHEDHPQNHHEDHHDDHHDDHHENHHEHHPEPAPVVHHPVTSMHDHISHPGDGYVHNEVYGKADPYGGGGGYGYHDPYRHPTERPTPRPSPRSTPRPTPYPTKKRSHRPTPYPTYKPTPRTSEEPSEQPTNSEEPSETPTGSEEPSESPTSSEEPSETPTGSEEPSENPTASEVPTTTNSRNTIAAFICADANARFFSTLCSILDAYPVIFGILNDRFVIDFTQLQSIPNFDFTVIPPRFDAIVGVVNINGRTSDEDGGRNLADNQQRQLATKQKLTLFAPDNNAFDRFLRRNLTNVVDYDNEKVVDFLERAGIDVSNNNTTVTDLLLSPAGSAILNQILLTHILTPEYFSSDLGCNTLYQMLSGRFTLSLCHFNGRRRYQRGDGNRDDLLPRITGENFEKSNGIVHVVNEVILPDIDGIILGNINFDPVNPPTGMPPSAHILDNSALNNAIIYLPRNMDDGKEEGGQ